MINMKNIIPVILCAILLLGPGCSKNSEKVSFSKIPFSDLYRIEEGFVDAHGIMIYYQAIWQRGTIGDPSWRSWCIPRLFSPVPPSISPKESTYIH